MAKQLARIRSKNATDTMQLLSERMPECAARGVPGTVTRDGETTSPARARTRTEGAAATAPAPAVNGGAALGVPMLLGLREEGVRAGAGQPEPAPPAQGADGVVAPGQTEVATSGTLPIHAPAAAAGSVAPGLPPAPPPMVVPPPFNPMMVP